MLLPGLVDFSVGSLTFWPANEFNGPACTSSPPGVTFSFVRATKAMLSVELLTSETVVDCTYSLLSFPWVEVSCWHINRLSSQTDFFFFFSSISLNRGLRGVLPETYPD